MLLIEAVLRQILRRIRILSTSVRTIPSYGYRRIAHPTAKILRQRAWPVTLPYLVYRGFIIKNKIFEEKKAFAFFSVFLYQVSCLPVLYNNKSPFVFKSRLLCTIQKEIDPVRNTLRDTKDC